MIEIYPKKINMERLQANLSMFASAVFSLANDLQEEKEELKSTIDYKIDNQQKEPITNDI